LASKEKTAMDVLDEVKQVIAKQARVPIDQLTADTRLETLGIESIDVIEIVFALEEKFGVTLPFNANESAVSEFETIGKVANAVKAVVGEKAPS
jgi:acyl carrier protein